jgi:hypothetical protein
MERGESDNEQLIFTFDGENNVDINLLVSALSGISESYKNVVYARSPEANIELKIEAFNKGSFDVIISSVVSNIPLIIPVAEKALSNVKLFLDVVKLKKDLKGKKPSQVIAEGDKAKVINQNGEIHYHNCEVTNIYLNNPLIDKGLTDVFSSLKGDKTRKNVKLKSKDEQVIIDEQEYENMAENLIEQSDDTDNKHVENQVTTELLLKKPDLLGKSKWQFQYGGKTISTVIEDKVFLQKVKSGEIKALYAHVKVPVRMKIEVVMNDKLEIVNKKHTILEVVGDIIEPQPYEQLKLI